MVLSSALTGGASVVVAVIDEELKGNEIYRRGFIARYSMVCMYS